MFVLKYIHEATRFCRNIDFIYTYSFNLLSIITLKLNKITTLFQGIVVKNNIDKIQISFRVYVFNHNNNV